MKIEFNYAPKPQITLEEVKTGSTFTCAGLGDINKDTLFLKTSDRIVSLSQPWCTWDVSQLAKGFYPCTIVNAKVVVE